MSEQFIETTTWANLARMLWQQMAYKPKGSADWNMANLLLHAMASEQFDVYACKPPDEPGRPV